MKIRELISMLNEYDGDTEVYVIGWDDSAGPANKVVKVFYDGHGCSYIEERKEEWNGIIID